MKIRIVSMAGLVMAPILLGGCDRLPWPPAKEPISDQAGSGADTRYPGPPDETLTEAQRTELRHRGNLQR